MQTFLSYSAWGTVEMQLMSLIIASLCGTLNAKQGWYTLDLSEASLSHLQMCYRSQGHYTTCNMMTKSTVHSESWVLMCINVFVTERGNRSKNYQEAPQ